MGPPPASPKRSFQRVMGQRDLPKLTAAIHREQNPTPTEEAAGVSAA